MHSFDTLAAGLLTVVNHSEHDQNDRVLSYLPLAHIMERSVLQLSSLYFGYHVFFAESLTSFAEDLRRARPTAFISVPRLWLKFQQGVLAKIPQKKLNRMLKTPVLGYFVRKKIVKQLGLDQAKWVGSGSAPMASDLVEWYQALGLNMHEGYGMTELGCTSHSTRVGGHAPLSRSACASSRRSPGATSPARRRRCMRGSTRRPTRSDRTPRDARAGRSGRAG